MNDRIIHKRSNSPNMKPIIEIKNLAAGYDGRTVLHDVDLNVYERDFLGIIGPNGGGKTTLIKCILGLLKPTAGEIIFHTPTEPSGTPQTVTSGAQTSLGYLPQYSTIDRKFPISVEEVILSGLSIQKSLTSRFTPEQKEKGKQIIVRMGLEGLEHRSIGQLSGGQQQVYDYADYRHLYRCLFFRFYTACIFDRILPLCARIFYIVYLFIFVLIF